ncbi:DMT family transporter [Agreia bicolorata]|uniref:Membrane protein n=1 Tax=Agreia bicolorata TaxID=110935 RepID=A0ABR5CGI7_9MICO|nr:DMT family transporter [Agreia bicolorata]KJC64723.1 membrane protein [Agreia bicolorata]
MPAPSSRGGLIFGVLGVLAFSFTLPFTRIAVEQIDPLFIGAGRAVVAAALAAVVLAVTRQRLPRGAQWLRLCVVVVGVVIGFPLLTSFALQTVPAAHGAVVIGLLPAATAIVAVIRAKERPSIAFWIASGAGVLAVIAFIALAGGGLEGLHPSDLLLLGAVVLAAIGYAEGALLSRELGSWQTICWALVVALPVMIPLTSVSIAAHGWPQADAPHWLAFGYLSLVSMFLGFFAWYRGLAIGPIAQVSQIQLVQPVLTIIWSALIVGERLDLLVWLGALVVVACAATAVRARVASSSVRAR